MTQPATPTPTRPPSGVPALMAALRAAGLLARAQLSRAESVAATGTSADEVARVWVTEGLLTAFQADRLLAGKTEGFLLGPYVVLEQIGRGATGRVYKARHRTMNRPVAVKVVSPELTRTEEDRAAFLAAARAAAQLNHPNVVVAYDANLLGDRFYLVSEFVDGPSFEALVTERGPLPVGEACELVRQAAEGLAHAHEHGMTHRDLKPTNILVARPTGGAPEPRVKIADFGVARASLAPSPDYLAPELAHNPALIDPRADVYSLGAVLYFLLAGRPPFPGGTERDKRQRHLWEEPARLVASRPDVWPMLAGLVHQMLAKQPERRPASSAEVAARLSALAGGGAVCLELPATGPTPFRFVAGPLSNTVPVPPGRALPAGVTPAPTPSPWEQITQETERPTAGSESVARESTEPPRPEAQRKRALPGWSVLALAAGVLTLCLIAAIAVVRTMAK